MRMFRGENHVQHIDPQWESRVPVIEDLAHRFGTPCYVYDTEVLRSRIELLRGALPSGSQVFYSVKANPCPGVVSELRTMNCKFEAASLGELKTVRGIGVSSENLILLGPAKDEKTLSRALQLGVGIVVVESISEMERLRRIVHSEGVGPVKVAIRLNPGSARGSLRMAGETQFGMSVEDAITSARRARELEGIEIMGFHGYLASELLSSSDVISNTRAVYESVLSVSRATGTTVRFLDVGGGFGIPYYSNHTEMELAPLWEGLSIVAEEAKAEFGVELSFEAGRFISGPAGVLVTRVVDVKTNGGRRFVILDGGGNACGLFVGQAGGRCLPFQVIRDGAITKGGEPTTICGPLCTPMDRLASSVECAASEGDLIVWYQTGAYGLSAGLSSFLSLPTPNEFLIRNGEVTWSQRDSDH